MWKDYVHHDLRPYLSSDDNLHHWVEMFTAHWCLNKGDTCGGPFYKWGRGLSQGHSK